MNDKNVPPQEHELDLEEAVKIDAITATSFAQSIAFTVQNEVDAIRNQNTVNMVAMGSAYAKWLENPTMSSEFEDLANKATLPNEPVFGPGSPLGSEASTTPAPRLATSLLSRFLQK